MIMLFLINLKSTVSFVEFSSRYAKDERFKGIEKMKDRELQFNDYLSDLRKQEKEEKGGEETEKEEKPRSFGEGKGQ